MSSAKSSEEMPCETATSLPAGLAGRIRPRRPEDFAGHPVRRIVADGAQLYDLTAYCAMEMFGRRPGQTLVVTSAAGSVGSYAVQLGKLADMKVVGVAGGEYSVVTGNWADACSITAERNLSAQVRVLPPRACTCSSPSADGSATPSSRDWRNFAVLIVGRTISNSNETADLDPVNMRMLLGAGGSIQ